MGSREQLNQITQNCIGTVVPLFSELLEVYGSFQIPFFQSSTDEAQHHITHHDDIYHQDLDQRVFHEDDDQKVENYSEPDQTQYYSSSETVVNTCHGRSQTDNTSRRNSTKRRMKWTQDLHHQFVECVNCLGGAERTFEMLPSFPINSLTTKLSFEMLEAIGEETIELREREATPRRVLKLMNSKMLTIYHVKSHLQKYRTSKYNEEHTKGKVDKRSTSCNTPLLDMNIGSFTQFKETIQQVNKRLQEQLKIQQDLQLMIEKQGKQLQMIFDEHQKTNKKLFMIKSSDSLMPVSNIDPIVPCNYCGSGHSFSITEDSRSSNL